MTDKIIAVERVGGSYYSGRVTGLSESRGRDGRGWVGGVKYSGLVTSEE